MAKSVKLNSYIYISPLKCTIENDLKLHTGTIEWKTHRSFCWDSSVKSSIIKSDIFFCTKLSYSASILFPKRLLNKTIVHNCILCWPNFKAKDENIVVIWKNSEPYRRWLDTWFGKLSLSRWGMKRNRIFSLVRWSSLHLESMGTPLSRQRITWSETCLQTEKPTWMGFGLLPLSQTQCY